MLGLSDLGDFGGFFPQERGGRVPLPGAAGSQAAQLPGQAAHRQGDRAGEDEEGRGTKPGPGEAFQRPGRAVAVAMEKIPSGMCFFPKLALAVSVHEWKSRIKPPRAAAVPCTAGLGCRAQLFAGVLEGVGALNLSTLQGGVGM